MTKTILLAAAAALASALTTTPAFASAWTQEQGHGQAILTGFHSNSDKGYDSNGDSFDIADYRKTEAYLLLEYGVTDDLTLMLTPSFRHVGIEGSGDDTTGLGYTEFGARYGLVQDGPFVASVQGSIRIPGKKRADSLAQVGSTDTEYDLRALAGTSFKAGGMDGFVDLQGAYRLRDGDPPNEFHADISVGIRPAPKVQLIAQLFNTWSDGSGRGVFPSYRYHNAHLSGVFDIDDKWSVQAGVMGTLGGENALRERGLILGLWRRF